MAGRVFTEAQKKEIVESLRRSSPGGRAIIMPGALQEQQAYAHKIFLAIQAVPSWKDHAVWAPAGSFRGMTDSGFLLEGIVVVVNDPAAFGNYIWPTSAV
jgi:hypothetical protein